MITVTYSCGHSGEQDVYVSDYDKRAYGMTESKRAADIRRGAEHNQCGPCYQSSMIAEETQRAAAQAQFISKELAESISPETQPRPRCIKCGAAADMAASLGPACPDCYDEMSS